MKGIVFTKEMLDARERGATQFIVAIKDTHIRNCRIEDYNNEKVLNCWHFDSPDASDYTRLNLPIQKGDEFFIQEPFMEDFEGNATMYKYNVFENGLTYLRDEHGNYEPYEVGEVDWNDASQMQEHQSRYKNICLDVQVKRVLDLTDIETSKVEGTKATDWISGKLMTKIKSLNNLAKQDIKYEENPYVFLITYKGIQK